MSVANPYFSKQGGGVADIALRKRAVFASVGVAFLLILTKLSAYLTTDSVSILASLLDSVFDVLTSSALLFSIVHASLPADRQHRFGHGKLEAVTALAQSLLIFISAVYILVEAIGRFIHPEPVHAVGFGIGVMALSIVLTAGLVFFQRRVISRTGSVIVRADERHYSGDLLFNLCVIVALLLSQYSDWPHFDSMFATGAALVLFYNAFGVAKHSIDVLMDRELPDATRVRIEHIVKAHPAVRAMHDLRTRHGGQKSFIEFHLELDGDLSLKATHDITDAIELMIYKEFPASEVLIHPEPAGLKDHRLDAQIVAE